MKKTLKYALLAGLLGLSTSAMAENVKLFSFQVPDTCVGKTTNFSLSAHDGLNVQVDWGKGELTAPVAIGDYDIAPWTDTEISGTVEGTVVTVYGDSISHLFRVLLNCASAAPVKKTGISFGDLSELTYLSIGYNNLKKLDITKLPKLVTLDAPDNQLETLVLVADSKKDKLESLTTLNVSNNYNVGTGLLNENGGNNQLLGTDWSVCPNLITLNVCGNLYSELGWFDTFDISGNTKLVTLNVNCCGLPSLDVTAQTALKTFNGQWNGFTGEFDLSKMVANGATVFIGHNTISSIKLPDTSTQKMTRVNIINNNFTFATLPAPGMTKAANNYIVSPQNDMQATLNADNVLDLSAQAKFGEVATVFTPTAKDAEGKALVLSKEGDDANYTEADGILTFKVPVSDLVVSMTNSTFSSLTLKTLPSTSLSLIPDAFSFEVAEAGQEFYSWYEMSVYVDEQSEYLVDMGDGNFAPADVQYDTWSDAYYFQLTGATKGTKVSVKGDAANINRIDYSASNYSDNPVKVASVDLSKLVNLKQLSLGNGEISSIDLSNNQKLTNVSLASQKLTSFDQALPELAKLNLSNANSNEVVSYGANAISTFDFDKYPALTDLDLSFTGYQMDWSKAGNLTNISMNGNGLTSADFSACPEVKYIYLRWNKLSVLDLSPVTTEVQCYAIDNNIAEIKLPEQKVGNLYIKGNKLNFATLPALDNVGAYTNYAPQQAMAVEVVDKTVDLSSQAKVGDVETVFAWTSLVEAPADEPAAQAEEGEEPAAPAKVAAEFTGYTVENGVFTFTESAEGAVCSMTNTAYPALTLTTVAVNVEVPQDAVSELAASSAAPVYYNLQGVRVANPTSGLYIRVANGKASKVLISK